MRFHARHRPTALALRHGECSLDWNQFDRRANKVANALIERLGPGPHRIAFLGHNSIPYFELMFGAAKAGITFVPLNWRLSGAELADILNLLEPSVVIFDQATANVWEALPEETRALVPSLRLGTEYEPWVAAAVDNDPLVPVCGCDIAIQLYTSGTTGTPKGVELSHGGFNLMRLCEHLEPALHWTADDVFMFVMPNFHLAGLSLAVQSLYNGGRVEILPVFEPEAVLRAISTHRPTILMLVPAMIQRLLDHPACAETNFSSVRLCMYAGSPIGLNLIKRAITEMNCEFMQFYGATETGGAATLLRPHEHDLEHEEKLKSCGRPLPLIELRIVDTDGRPVPQGGIGEFVIRAPALFRSYWRNPDVTDQVRHDGWYWTGDVGFLDTDGLYYIVDRTKDMIVSGGENIYCSEVEQALHKHPAVRQAAVVGIPDQRWGETVKAFVILRERMSVTDEELVAHCRSLIAGFKIPRSIDFVEALPISPTGKVLKRELRKKHWDGHGRNVG